MRTPPRSDELAFRAEVSSFRAGERRRVFPMRLHVGAPAGPRRLLEVPWPVPSAYDAGVRFDLADALVDGLRESWPTGAPAWGWVTRPGVAEVHDCDLAWLAAFRRAFGAHGLPLAGFRAVTRTGWLDVVTGDSRTWKRPRAQSQVCTGSLACMRSR